MSREIKFRLYSKHAKKYIDYLTIGFSKTGELRSYSTENGVGPVLEDSYIVEQYTGLKDKNGKEIYEGDIVEYDWYIIGDKPAYRVNSAVNFDYKGAMVGNNRLWKCTNIEVIGNIHEDSELLGGEDEE